MGRADADSAVGGRGSMRTATFQVLTALLVAVLLVAAPGCGDKADDGDGAKSYAKAGYRVFEEDGRLWVFKDGSDALKEYENSGEPAKSVTLVGAGPDGKTIRSVDKETIQAYLSAK
jgi:hypothetical protein